MLIAMLAVVLFAAPLGLALSRLHRNQAETALAREASRAAGAISAQAVDGSVTLRLPGPVDQKIRLGVYDAAGRRVAGRGPADTELARAVARDGAEHVGVTHGLLAVAVPLQVGRQDRAVLAATLNRQVLARIWTAWGGMAVLGLGVLAVAGMLARQQAGRIAQPLEALTTAAYALGTGDFSIRARPCGLQEVDDASRALQATAERLGRLLERERAFSADASHQMRTPLTALRLSLESALLAPPKDPRTAIEDALNRLNRVENTVEELLALARDTLTPTEPVDLIGLLEQARSGRWGTLVEHAGRRLVITAEPDLPPARASAAVLHQVLDVLVGNTLAHGAGTITVRARQAASGLAVEVSDEGPGFDEAAQRSAFVRRHPSARGHGIGLALARDLAEADGGRLVLIHTGPAPVIALMLPRSDAAPSGSPDA